MNLTLLIVVVLLLAWGGGGGLGWAGYHGWRRPSATPLEYSGGGLIHLLLVLAVVVFLLRALNVTAF
jgi:hypothetical protein